MSTECSSTGEHGDVRDVLESHRRQITTDLQLRMARIRDSAGHASTPEPDHGDPYDLDVGLMEIAAANLHHVDQALGQLGRGQYGLCRQCLKPISEPRLKALPFAMYCRSCQATRESVSRSPQT